MDRVVCCDPDFTGLLTAASVETNRYPAASFPHDVRYLHAFTAWLNGKRR